MLLGDPQQLTQPGRAQHPYGADVSALDHVLGGHDTMPPNRGIFLDCTWRTHPATNEFVSITSYDGRLRTADRLQRQRVIGGGWWHGSGLRWLPVEHTSSVNASCEEEAVVARTVEELLETGGCVRCGGVAATDILVVAPYNAQVARLRQTVGDGVQIGTVDKFQGRRTPVVLYSLASSSAQDAPHGSTSCTTCTASTSPSPAPARWRYSSAYLDASTPRRHSRAVAARQRPVSVHRGGELSFGDMPD